MKTRVGKCIKKMKVDTLLFLFKLIDLKPLLSNKAYISLNKINLNTFKIEIFKVIRFQFQTVQAYC